MWLWHQWCATLLWWSYLARRCPETYTNDHFFNKCWWLGCDSNLEPFIYQTYIVHPFNLAIVPLSTTNSVRNLHTLKHIGVETRQAIPHFWLGLCNKWKIFSCFELKSFREGFWRRIWDCMKQSQLTWVREGIKK